MALSKLGKSFSELIDANRESVNEEVLKVSIDSIKPNRNQPRRRFEEAALSELSQSLKAHGLLQPILLTKSAGGYELVAGERRWRAAQMLGWKTLPARVLDMDEVHSMQAALVENIQREDLNAIECARSYKGLITQFGLTQQQIAQQVGKNRSTVANTLRLLELPEAIQQMLLEKKLTMGHARALLALNSGQEQMALAEKVLKSQLSVRNIEEMVSAKATGGTKAKQKEDPNIAEMARVLSEALGTRVQIQQGKSKGKITIEYYTLDDFDRLKAKLLG